VIAYSPYASEDVFLKESDVVTRVMSERFGTSDRTLRMVNHRSTVETIAWATPDNLKKALDHIGTLIDPAEDMVFIHFASHGGSVASSPPISGRYKSMHSPRPRSARCSMMPTFRCA
jgi:hypothetical protein